MSHENKPLCVDLDGTLLKTDSLHESIAKLLKSKPASVLLLPFFLLRGRSGFKAAIAEKIQLNTNALPFREEVVEFLSEQKRQGREVLLVTAAHESIADSVLRHFDFFSGAMASTSEVNLKGETKRKALVDRFGERGFDYIGDSSADLQVWKSARQALLVGNDKSILREVEKTTPVEKSFADDTTFSLKSFLKGIRIHQWSKNILVFAPLILAHRWDDWDSILGSIYGFTAFSVLASGVYLFNDLVDLESDRNQPTKRNRPLASGKFPILLGLALAPILMLTGLILGTLASSTTLAVLIGYLALTFGYSFYLKRVLMLDTVILASLYTVRLLVGSAASDIELSPWLLSFSLFFFLSLAHVKRLSELLEASTSQQDSSDVSSEGQLKGRAYRSIDRYPIMMLGVSSGIVAILILSLYLNSEQVQMLYARPDLLWAVTPFLFYWLGRIWVIANRGAVHSDPVVFAIQDRVSYLVFAIVGIVMLWATYGWLL